MFKGARIDLNISGDVGFLGANAKHTSPKNKARKVLLVLDTKVLHRGEM